jgi:hypothetical protein
MPYRPQFPFPPAPEGWQDEDFQYVFNVDNTPGFAVGLLPGEAFLNVNLPFETDAEYRVRSIEVIDPNNVLALRFRDAWGTYITEAGAFLPSQVLEVSGRCIPQEPELICSPGSSLTVDVLNTA